MALNATYAYACLERKHYNPKTYLDPSDAKFNNEKELIIDHIDLVNELSTFLSYEDGDSEEAEEYLKAMPEFVKYGEVCIPETRAQN